MIPNCPSCGRRLVYVAVAIQSAGVVYKGWNCDCLYRNPKDEASVPGDIIAQICRAREWDEAGICMVELEANGRK